MESNKGEARSAGSDQAAFLYARRLWSAPTRSGEGAVYEVQWFGDAPLTQLVGSATVTQSEIEVPGLTKGQQYWFRIRAVRGGQSGPWSNEATRVANI